VICYSGNELATLSNAVDGYDKLIRALNQGGFFVQSSITVLDQDDQVAGVIGWDGFGDISFTPEAK